MVHYSTNDIQSNQLHFVVLMFFVFLFAGVTQNDVVFVLKMYKLSILMVMMMMMMISVLN